MLSISVYDVDNKTMVPIDVNGSMWITTDGSNYGSSIYVQTNSSGYLNHDFDPNCTYSVGGQYWIGGVSNDECYVDTNISNPEYLEVIGQLKNYLEIPTYQTFYVTEPVPISFTTYSDCKDVPERSDENPVINASDFSIEIYHPNEGWINCSSQNLYNGSYNCTFDSTGHEEGNWSIRFYSTKSYFNSLSLIHI